MTILVSTFLVFPPVLYANFLNSHQFVANFFQHQLILISTVVPILLKKFFTLLLGGQIGTGPFFNEIGGKGMALRTFAFTFIALFN